MFLIVLTNVLVILFYMIIGFVLGKTRMATASHAKSMSALLIYVLSPLMILNAFLKMDYTTESLGKMGIFFGITFVVQFLFMMLLFAIFRKKYQDARYRILTVGSVLANVGFFGMPVIQAIFPEEPIVSCYSSINVVSMNLIVFTLGVFLITNDKKYISLKGAIVNPSTIALIVSLPLMLLRVQLPAVLGDAITLLAKMVTPMCMIILGLRLATVKFKDLFSRPFVYATCALKLIAFPAFAYLAVRFLPFMDNIAKTTVVVLAAAPSAAIIQSLSELHECEQELSANVVLLATILSVIFMPLVLSVLHF